MVQNHIHDPEGADIREYKLLLQDAGGRKAGIQRKTQAVQQRLREEEGSSIFPQEGKQKEGKEIAGNDQDT